MSSVTAGSVLLEIAFGAGESTPFHPGLRVLGGEAVENLFPLAHPAGNLGRLVLFQAGGWRFGAATLSVADGLEAASQQIYQDICLAAKGLHLARIWNYVPAINEAGPGGLENYRLFCRGRSLAFEQCHGSGFKALLPSASAVGSTSDSLTVVFAACDVAPHHVENPLQVPAYEYPVDYGPRAPSFARATVVASMEGSTVFISGTAAIRGHATVAPHDLNTQLDCALENLGRISAACSLGSDLDRSGSSERHFKIYLRRASDQLAVAARLEADVLRKNDHVSYLQADICRESLLVEIEATLFGAGR